MAKNEQTSKRVGSKASKQLRSGKTSKDGKSVAGSALTQRPNNGPGKGSSIKKGTKGRSKK